LVLIVLVAIALHALVIQRYFFALPLYFDILVAALLVLAWARLGEEKLAPATR
jgi:hypothetical protein